MRHVFLPPRASSIQSLAELRKRAAAIALVGACAVLSTSCAPERPKVVREEWTAPAIVETAPRVEPVREGVWSNADEPRIQGVLGPLAGVDAPARASVFDDRELFAIENVGESQDRFVMMAFGTSSDRAALLQPGVHHTILPFAPDNTSDAYLLGCVGQEEGVYDVWDAPAGRIDVDTETGPDADGRPSLRVRLTGTWFEEAYSSDLNGEVRSTATTEFLLRP